MKLGQFVEYYMGQSIKGCLPQILLGPFLNTLSPIRTTLMEKNMEKINTQNYFQTNTKF